MRGAGSIVVNYTKRLVESLFGGYLVPSKSESEDYRICNFEEGSKYGVETGLLRLLNTSYRGNSDRLDMRPPKV
jgi:hypothetical protein